MNIFEKLLINDGLSYFGFDSQKTNLKNKFMEKNRGIYGHMIYVTNYFSPLGNIILGSDGNALVGLWLEGQKHFLSKYQKIENNDNLEIFKEAKLWLDEYFKGNNPAITMLLKPAGTEFQKNVWNELEKIPYGKTVTYSDIAGKLGTRSSQAVGGAVGKNPISILIPCHRVIGKNKSLIGYAGGIDKKLALLRLENSSFKIQEDENEIISAKEQILLKRT